MASDLRGREDYHTLFDWSAYLTDWHLETCEGWSQTVKCMESLHKIYSEGQVKGKRIIEIGCGPILYSLIPASKWFDELYLADFCRSNVEAAQKWLQKDPESFDWKTHFQLFAELDGNRCAWHEYENMVRTKVKGAFLCDYFQSNPLHPEVLGEFDAITTAFALISGNKTIEEYRNALKNLVNMLKPGGFLIEVAALEAKFYRVGNKKFLDLSVTKDDVLEAFKDAGLVILKYIEEPLLSDSKLSLNMGSLTVLGQKIRNTDPTTKF